MDGWNEDKVYEVVNVMDEIANAKYELDNCVRGCYTGAHTYSDLSNYICRLAEKLQYAGESLAYEQEDEEEEDDE